MKYETANSTTSAQSAGEGASRVCACLPARVRMADRGAQPYVATRARIDCQCDALHDYSTGGIFRPGALRLYVGGHTVISSVPHRNVFHSIFAGAPDERLSIGQ